MDNQAGAALLTEHRYQAEQAYDRWQQAPKGWRVMSADWRATIRPFADRIADLGLGDSMVPLQLIGRCDVYCDPDGTSSMRDEYTFLIGGSYESGGASVYLGRWKGLVKKRIAERMLGPRAVSQQVGGMAFDGFFPEVTSEHGNTWAAIQFVRSGLPVVKLSWWGRDRQRGELIAITHLFADALRS